MKNMLKALTKAENGIMFAAFAVMVASSFAQVVNRNFFKLPITWFDEASTYCMIYMALIGSLKKFLLRSEEHTSELQ